jgi:DNA-dependent protein kinase catalytic subunit
MAAQLRFVMLAVLLLLSEFFLLCLCLICFLFSAEFGEDAAMVRSSDWYPRRKMHVVQLKLNGRNPAYILSLELRENRNITNDPKLLAACISHLAGEPGHKRAQLDLVCQPDEQVQVLLEMGKDPNILGRTWVGWGPFI